MPYSILSAEIWGKTVTYDKLAQLPVMLKSVYVVTTMCSASPWHGSNQHLYLDLWYHLSFMLQRLAELAQ
jgi:hypothetical protein